MFPALTSEFMKAENDYRHSRSHRSFVEHGALRDGRGRRSRRTFRHQQPTVDRAVWSTRSA